MFYSKPGKSSKQEGGTPRPHKKDSDVSASKSYGGKPMLNPLPGEYIVLLFTIKPDLTPNHC